MQVVQLVVALVCMTFLKSALLLIIIIKAVFFPLIIVINCQKILL